MLHENKPEIGVRLSSMIIDYFLNGFIAIIPVLFGFILSIPTITEKVNNSDEHPYGVVYLFMLCPIILLAKDSFQGRSLAKRIFKIQLVDTNGFIASPFRCFVRNLTVIIWPIEVIFVLISTERRLGDYIAGTKLVYFDKKNKKPENNFISHVGMMIIALVYIQLANNLSKYFFDDYEGGYNQVKVDFLHDSYSEKYSKDYSLILSKRMTEFCDSVSVRYYNKTNIDSIKYIEAVLHVKDRAIAESIDASFLCRQTFEKVLHKKISPEIYCSGKLHYHKYGQNYMDWFRIYPYLLKNTANNNHPSDSVRILKTFHKGGKVASETKYIHEVVQGDYKEWYSNGQLKLHVKYVDGNMEGVHTTWYSNGQKECEILYDSGEFVREINRWSKRGKKLKTN